VARTGGPAGAAHGSQRERPAHAQQDAGGATRPRRAAAQRDRPPPPPLFSHYQTSAHADILCPSGRFRIDKFDDKMLRRGRLVAWENKTATAFWRGAPYCGRPLHGACSRSLLAHLAAQLARLRASDRWARGERQTLGAVAPPAANVSGWWRVELVAGLSYYARQDDPFDRHRRCVTAAASNASNEPACEMAGALHLARARSCSPRCSLWGLGDNAAGQLSLPVVADEIEQQRPFPMSRHAEHKYLLHLDGHSCSSRLQSLLATGSPILKQRSYFWGAFVGLYLPLPR